MTVRVITPPTVTNLVTAAQVTEFTGYSAANIHALIPVVSRMIIERIGRHVLYGQYEEALVGPGGQMLQLEVVPLDEAQPIVIEIDGSTVDSDSYRIEDPEAGWLFTRRGWPNSEPRTLWLTESIVNGAGERVLKATYWGGWLIDIGDPGNTTLPEELAYAAALGVRYAGQRASRNTDVTRWRSADVDITYAAQSGRRSGDELSAPGAGGFLPEDVLSIADCYADVIGGL